MSSSSLWNGLHSIYDVCEGAVGVTHAVFATLGSIPLSSRSLYFEDDADDFDDTSEGFFNEEENQQLPQRQQQQEQQQQQQLHDGDADNSYANEECAICLESMEHGPCKSLVCRHTFHEECISFWLKSSIRCPLCRSYNISDSLPEERQLHFEV